MSDPENTIERPEHAKFSVWHPEGSDHGLIAPKFSTYAEA
jgi:hypothetical protein